MHAILEEVREVGLAQRKASDLVDYVALRADYMAFAQGQHKLDPSKPYLIRKIARGGELSKASILYQTALMLSDMVEDYLGPDPTILEVNHWYALPYGDQRVGSQKWHRDIPGGLPCIKVFIFYSRVD